MYFQSHCWILYVATLLTPFSSKIMLLLSPFAIKRQHLPSHLSFPSNFLSCRKLMQRLRERNNVNNRNLFFQNLSLLIYVSYLHCLTELKEWISWFNHVGVESFFLYLGLSWSHRHSFLSINNVFELKEIKHRKI